jgi:hypothetical protein
MSTCRRPRGGDDRDRSSGRRWRWWRRDGGGRSYDQGHIAYLLSAQAIDWPDFWRRAEEGRCRRACWLTLRLVERYWGHQPIDWPELELDSAAAESAMDTAALLMLREVSVSSDVRLAHELGQQGTWLGRLGLLRRRSFPSRAVIASAYPVRADSPRVWLYYLRHLWRQASQRLRRF